MKVTEALSKEQLDQYLLRIRLQHPEAANLTTLEAVVHGHTHSIPFENLSLTHPLAVPTSGEPAISTDQQAVFNKLVLKQRGGYCFEVRTMPVADPARMPARGATSSSSQVAKVASCCQLLRTTLMSPAYNMYCLLVADDRYLMQTTQLVSAALRALGFDVYDGAARVVESAGDPRQRQVAAGRHEGRGAQRHRKGRRTAPAAAAGR